MPQINPAQAPLPPVIPSGTEVYDQIMGEIELDLTSTARPTLEEKYKNETPEQRSERGRRYHKALEEYQKQYVIYKTDLEGKIRAYELSVVTFVERGARAEEEQTLTNLETAMAAA